MKSITQVYLQQIRLKRIQIITKTSKQLHAYYYQWKRYKNQLQYINRHNI